MLRARTASPPMGSQEDPASIPRWRVVLFRVLARLSGAFFLSTPPQAISPWHGPTLSNLSGVHDPDLHRWFADEYPNQSAGGLLLACTDQRQQASASPRRSRSNANRR